VVLHYILKAGVNMTKIFSQYLDDLWNEAERLSRETIKEMLSGEGVEVLLDCGCDDGSFTEEVTRAIGSTKTIGIEIEADRAALARERGIDVRTADLNEGFPVSNEEVDGVVLNQVIEHLNDTDNLMSEIWRILKPGGVAVIATENLSSWHNIFALVMGWQPFSLTNLSSRMSGIGNPLVLHRGRRGVPLPLQHQRLFTARALLDMAKLYGFLVERMTGSGCFPLPMMLAGVFSRMDPAHSAFLTVKLRRPRGA
jgi:SAM-dependent methyltransferase